jgi:FKBP-type peptidyl-prolyl cis-trans isomerase FkpA
MRKFSKIIFLSVITFASCKKDNNQNCSPVSVTAPSSEVEALQAYIKTNNITATEDPRGFFYSISAPGNNKPTACDAVTVSYSGKLTDGTQFDAANNVTFNLSNLILGWQEGIPLIGTGGSITLYLPPALGYGSAGSGSIPANSILIFNISLSGVN